MRQNAYGPADRQAYADHVRRVTQHLAPHIRDAGDTYADYIERGFPYVDSANNALVIDDFRWIFDAGFESQLADKSDLDNAHATNHRLRKQLEEQSEAHARETRRLHEIIAKLGQK